jgi:hypothetical protein
MAGRDCLEVAGLATVWPGGVPMQCPCQIIIRAGEKTAMDITHSINQYAFVFFPFPTRNSQIVARCTNEVCSDLVW